VRSNVATGFAVEHKMNLLVAKEFEWTTIFEPGLLWFADNLKWNRFIFYGNGRMNPVAKYKLA